MNHTSITSDDIPCLASHCIESLHLLEKKLLNAHLDIEAWLRDQWRQTPPPFYASVDLRNAGFKLAPVDTNLFPAGFNNLKEEFIPLAVQAAQQTLERLLPKCLRILIIPENHTRNRFYFENLAALHDILIQAGFEVRIGSLLEDTEDEKEIFLASGRSLVLNKIQRVDDQLSVNNFLPCMLILNTDLANGIPEIFKGIRQKIYPAPALGWHTRLKSQHFKLYQQVCEELMQLIQLDPWLISPFFTQCEGIDFMQRTGEEQMIAQSEQLLANVQNKYQEYGIKEKPYVVIKADAGTYGMGVLSIHDPADIQTLNRKKRSDMMRAKGNRRIEKVIIQEGVYTFETWNNAVAEPVVYIIGQYVVGGFYRVHTGLGVSDNLNSPGMQFEPLPFVKSCNVPAIATTNQESKCRNRFYIYGLIARLAVLAAAREQAAVLKTELE